jgi:hypothetical protein
LLISLLLVVQVPFASKNFVQKNALIEIEKNSLWKRARRAKLKKIHLGNERDYNIAKSPRRTVACDPGARNKPARPESFVARATPAVTAIVVFAASDSERDTQ